METFLLALLVFALFFVFAGIGYIFQKKELKGSCGGLQKMANVTGPCEICGDDPNKCDEQTGGTGTQAV